MPGSTQAVAFAGIDLEQPVHVLAGVDDERGADGLAALRRAGAARQDRHAGGDGDLGGADGLVGRARHDDAERLDLVDRRVRRIAAAAPGVEQHFARELAAKACLKGVERRSGHAAGVDLKAEGGYCMAAPPRRRTAGDGRKRWRRFGYSSRFGMDGLLKYRVW